MKPIEEIKSVIVNYTRNGNVLSYEDFLKVKELLFVIDDDNQFGIMSIACLLSSKYKPVVDDNDKESICFYYCVNKPAECPMLIQRGIIEDMNSFFLNVKRYCLKLIKEEV